MGKKFQASLLLLLLVSGAGWFVPGAWAQKAPPLLVNGKPFDEKGCLKLSELRSITIPHTKQDSLGVAIHLAHGFTGLGAKGFTSIKAFNTFDLVSWLQAERPVANPTYHNIEMDANGDSFTKARARDGSRIIIRVFSYKKVQAPGATYKLGFCR
ncbi:hypothetical protein LJY25_09135 [Hymenobacter sp. BT175]|uniref:hypothetical protein n=1 Tax=Hymenobacter translucens TaxID=2886507 RepID=UPI001D0EBE0C|nr:hypothetical protein [Hymenobacter translucens]MCC2546605.1 hypothetical protein [Hymenobacter translucens]